MWGGWCECGVGGVSVGDCGVDEWGWASVVG